MPSFLDKFKKDRLTLESIKLATNNFGHDNFIGKGGFGRVYKGEFLVSTGLKMGAAKHLDRSQEKADISFLTEIKLLSSFRHENIISFLGFCDEGGEKIIVYEYASNGSLDFHLDKPDLTWILRLKICLGAARGLAYLHDPRESTQRVIHRDIKSANILLDANWNAKLADFGLSRYADQKDTLLLSEAKGTVGYCDPNYVSKHELTKESDVYSFGVVLLEVLCSRLCFDSRYTDVRKNLVELVKKSYQKNELDTVIDGKLKEQMEPNSFAMFVKIAFRCLEMDRRQRPPMAVVVKSLRSALKHQEDFESNSEDAKRRNIVSNHVILKDVVNPLLDFDLICPPGGSDSLILYTTTGINTMEQAFKDCLRIRGLLEDFKVLYQERDVSIHWDYKEEVWRMFGTQVALPRLFIKGRYIGGAEEVLQLHEQGKIQPLLAGMPQIISQGESSVYY